MSSRIHGGVVATSGPSDDTYRFLWGRSKGTFGVGGISLSFEKSPKRKKHEA
jgi:hypothetical protein